MERLDKILAAQGLSSRKDVKTFIRRGAVTVNGTVVKSADMKIDIENDIITFEGKALSLKKHIYIMMNKPMGVISASRDEKASTVVDLVPKKLMRKDLFPAGRLDKDTEGFVLITDDGDFAHRILSPKNHIPKTYIAKLDKPITEEVGVEFSKGVKLTEEDICSPAQLVILDNSDEPTVQVKIYEGMYHQIKRMFLRYGYTVIYLKRIKMGGLPLDEGLKLGESREISDEEIRIMLLAD